MPNQWIEIDRPDILIVEGLNVLQTGRPPRDGAAIPFVSDFLRFLGLSRRVRGRVVAVVCGSFSDPALDRVQRPESYFHRYSKLSDDEAVATATSIWTRINLVNLHENVLPTRQRADLILRKGASHYIEEVALRKL